MLKETSGVKRGILDPSHNSRGRTSQSRYWDNCTDITRKNYNSLKADIDEDIQCLEKFISHLEYNVDSLAEVVLQNR